MSISSRFESTLGIQREREREIAAMRENLIVEVTSNVASILSKSDNTRLKTNRLYIIGINVIYKHFNKKLK